MDYSDGLFAGLVATLGIFMIFFVILFVAIVVVFLVGKCKMYKKTGKQGWEAIVPFYSQWVYTEIAGVEWWWFFALLFTNLFSISSQFEEGLSFNFNFGAVIGFIGSFVCNYNISKKLHKDTGFAVLMSFLGIVMIPLIGFSNNYSFDNNVNLTKNGPFDDKKNNTTSSNNINDKKEDKDSKFCTNCGNKLGKNDKFCNNCGKEI